MIDLEKEDLLRVPAIGPDEADEVLRLIDELTVEDEDTEAQPAGAASAESEPGPEGEAESEAEPEPEAGSEEAAGEEPEAETAGLTAPEETEKF